MASTAKKIAAKLHLWLGLGAGLVVFIVALTGSILVFEEELEPIISPSFFTVSVPANPHRLPLDQLLATATTKFPGKPISRVVVEPHLNRTVIVELKRSKKDKDLLSVALNPYTGSITDTRIEQNAFFTVVLRLHRYLCMGDTGKIITGVSCSMFLVIMFSGLILWWPNRKNRKQRFTIKWGASFKRLNWDLHAVAGFYVLPFIFLIAFTGLIWSYKWVNNLLFYVLDGKPQAKREAPRNPVGSAQRSNLLFEKIYSETNRQLPYQGRIIFSFPKNDKLTITLSKRNDEAVISNIVDFLYYDNRTGDLVKKRLYDNETRGFKARRIIFPIHTGSMFGWPTKLIALFAALIAASLPLSGFYIWWGRTRKTSRKKTSQKSSSKRKRVMEPQLGIQNI